MKSHEAIQSSAIGTGVHHTTEYFPPDRTDATFDFATFAGFAHLEPHARVKYDVTYIAYKDGSVFKVVHRKNRIIYDYSRPATKEEIDLINDKWIPST